MKTFRDATETEWVLSITTGAIKRVLGLTGENLANMAAGDPPLMTRLGADVILLCDVIYALIKPQADERAVTDEEFGRRLDGAAIARAHAAFWEEIADFFRGIGRADVVSALAKQVAIVSAAIGMTSTRIEAINVDRLLGTPGG